MSETKTILTKKKIILLTNDNKETIVDLDILSISNLIHSFIILHEDEDEEQDENEGNFLLNKLLFIIVLFTFLFIYLIFLILFSFQFFFLYITLIFFLFIIIIFIENIQKFPLPTISKNILDKIIEFCRYYKEHPMDPIEKVIFFLIYCNFFLYTILYLFILFYFILIMFIFFFFFL